GPEHGVLGTHRPEVERNRGDRRIHAVGPPPDRRRPFSRVPNLAAMPEHASRFDTHEVVNQAPPLVGYDGFGSDAALREAVEREGGAWGSDELHDLGRRAGSAQAQELGRQANETPPALRTHDRYG